MAGSRFVTALFLLVFGAVCVAVVRLLWVFVTPIVLAMILVSLFSPLHRRLRQALGGRERPAAAIATGLVVVVVVVPVSLFATTLVQQAVDIGVRTNAVLSDPVLVEARIRAVTERLPIQMPEERLDALTVRLRDLYGEVDASVRSYVKDHVGNLESLEEEAPAVQEDASPGPGLGGVFRGLGQAGILLYQGLTAVASNTASVLFHFGIMIVVLFALFRDGERLLVFLLDLSPLPDEQERAVVRRFGDMSRAVFLGNGTASVLQGLFGGLGFVLFGLGPGALWGAVIAFLAFLPIVGAMVVFVPVTLYLLLTGRTVLALAYLAYNMTYVTVLEYGLKPRLIGDRVRMHPVLVFLGIVAGLSLFGVLGLFYGPLTLAMFLTLVGIYRDGYRDGLLSPSPGDQGPGDPPPVLPPAPPAAEEIAASPDPADAGSDRDDRPIPPPTDPDG